MGDAALDKELEPVIVNDDDKPSDVVIDDEVEIVLESEEEEEDKPVPAKRNPVRDLRQRNKVLKRETKDLNNENAELKARLDRLERGEKPADVKQPVVETVSDVAPTLEDAGYDAELYQKRYTAWSDKRLDHRIAEHVKGADSRGQKEDGEAKAEGLIEAHYKRASDLRVADYEKTEDAAVEAMGVDLVQAIQGTVDNSETLIYYLGKNPAKAEKIAKIFADNPGKGTFELGKLSSRLTLQPKTKVNDKPNPDIPLKGGGGAHQSSNFNKFKKQLDKAYDDADINGARAIRREAKAAGVELPYS